MTNASPQSLDGALCLNSSDLSFLPAATGQTMTCSTNPAWLMFLTSVKWERSPQNADYLAPKCTQAYPAAEHEMKSLQMWFHLKGTMGRLPSYLGTKWLFLFSSQHGWSVQEALLSLWKPEIPITGGWSASQREVSVSFNWGGGGKEEERSEGIEDAGKLPSGAGVCQQQAAPMHTVGKCGPAWAGPGLRKTNQAYNGKYTDKRVCVCVTVHSHTTTNAPFLANRESFKTFFLTLNASPLHKTQKSGVHLPKIKPYLHHWVKNVQFANCVLYKWTLRLFGHLLISREKNTFHTGLLTFTDRRYSICLNNSFVDFIEKQSRGDKTHIRLKV